MIRIESGKDAAMVKSPYNPDYIAKIKAVKGYRWHPDKKCWSIPYSQLKSLLSTFDGEKVEINTSVWFYEQRKELMARKYSRRTVKLYLHYNEEFLRFCNKTPYQVSNDDVRNYLYYLAEKGCSASTLNIAINALKFYYGEILKRRFVYEIKRPKKDKRLPAVFSQEEVSGILSSITNTKHKLILMFMYSAGLRVGEVVRLRVEDMDVERRLIRIRGGKGRKDRYTILSEVASKTLKEYLRKYKPEKRLFSGQRKYRHITTRTVQKIFENACRKAEIKKDVTVHSLHHSFATHLLESGVDLRYIQEQLGHKSSKTTEIYTHVAMKDLRRIRSPLDLMGGDKKDG
ncbi:site-specific tyrosine recombinase/integron integrase [Thermodesulforhabdus norvegica]|uniref:Site-specific recombinase XerD n=1 Tax=Thermodesulforhabdus norvegica TaxID=39841 RepID=A0A1I4VVW0_9BACT|nr:site-specific tyrosine recombinase/integron integrase [Thermodesulforhabdus norvegica]SFN05335.1 Site-specific recombinase XerD [Thermodesulforhabdus norvegica]